jgi:hypothetical protein
MATLVVGTKMSSDLPLQAKMTSERVGSGKDRNRVVSTTNTYDWLITTADSKISSRICAIISTHSSDCIIAGPLFPSRINNRCPAIMFAVNRTASVPHWITFLIVSIHTINGIRMVGVPCGTRYLNIWFVLIHPNIINLTHSGRANVSVTIRWLILVKMYGNIYI